MKSSNGVAFDETLRGTIALSGNLGDSLPLRGDLTARLRITIPDFASARAEGHLRGSIDGTIECAPLGGELSIGAGRFDLMSAPGEPHMKAASYEMDLELDRDRVLLTGTKEIRDAPGFDLWTDTTTVFTRLHRGRERTGSVLGAGVLKLTATEFERTINSVHAVDATSAEEAERIVAALVRLIAGGPGADAALTPWSMEAEPADRPAPTTDWIPPEIVRMKSWA